MVSACASAAATRWLVVEEEIVTACPEDEIPTALLALILCGPVFLLVYYY